MGYREISHTELPALFRAATDGDVAAVVRLAAAMEAVDRDEDAVKLWQLAAALGDTLAAAYVRDHIGADGTVQRPHWDEVLDQVLALVREQQSSLVDHDWLDAEVKALLKVPVCAVHRRLEPDRPGDYKTCGECFHVWRTREEFVADVARVRRELDQYEAAHPELTLDPQLIESLDVGLTGYVPVVGEIDDPWTEPSAARGLSDEDICPLCTHTF